MDQDSSATFLYAVLLEEEENAELRLEIANLKEPPVSTKQRWIATLARNNQAMAFTSLNQYMDYNWLLQAYQLTRKDGATDVDGQTSEMYERQLESNLLFFLLGKCWID